MDAACTAPGADELFREDLMRTRGIDFAYLGMTVEVQGDRAWIEGLNASANLKVRFEDIEKFGEGTRACHPTWRVTYFDESGVAIAAYNDRGCVFKP